MDHQSTEGQRQGGGEKESVREREKAGGGGGKDRTAAFQWSEIDLLYCRRGLRDP